MVSLRPICRLIPTFWRYEMTFTKSYSTGPFYDAADLSTQNDEYSIVVIGRDVVLILNENGDPLKSYSIKSDEKQIQLWKVTVISSTEIAILGTIKDRLFFLTVDLDTCLLYTSPSPRDATLSRMPSSA